MSQHDLNLTCEYLRAEIFKHSMQTQYESSRLCMIQYDPNPTNEIVTPIKNK